MHWQLDEYLIPTQFGEDEFYEKKSRFIGRAWPVETEEEALEKIQAMKKQHYDATHNCWAYIIKDGAVRFSDDGEPGGTAGMPMLLVLQREGRYNIVCVVTRYFGGIIRDTEFGAEVELELLFPEANTEAFFEKLTDMTSGTVEGMETGKEYRAFPIDT